MAARDQPEVDRLRIAQVAALGDLHRVDVTDQVGDAGVGGGELLGVAFAAVAPLDRQVVAQLGGAAAPLRADRFVRVLAELGAGDHRGPLVEQPDEGPQQPGLALAALAEQDDVVARDEGALQLGEHRVAEAVQARPRVLTPAEHAEEVVADLLTHTPQPVPAGTQFAERTRSRWSRCSR
ncbi:hypothetical protein SDC9_99437 [bioreactor metagenome]|uniref:Uncharacterized protein n=1 Tax=bioreactor metagenome TaxID=1076179 RepID=A0A645AI43_9ZZZZ